jgi:hypothetical protein
VQVAGYDGKRRCVGKRRVAREQPVCNSTETVDVQISSPSSTDSGAR